MKYTYSFSVWPDASWNFEKAVYYLFSFLNDRIEINFTKEEFEEFRSSLSHHGITLHEVERIPYFEPEIIL